MATISNGDSVTSDALILSLHDLGKRLLWLVTWQGEGQLEDMPGLFLRPPPAQNCHRALPHCRSAKGASGMFGRFLHILSHIHMHTCIHIFTSASLVLLLVWKRTVVQQKLFMATFLVKLNSDFQIRMKFDFLTPPNLISLQHLPHVQWTSLNYNWTYLF